MSSLCWCYWWFLLIQVEIFLVLDMSDFLLIPEHLRYCVIKLNFVYIFCFSGLPVTSLPWMEGVPSHYCQVGVKVQVLTWPTLTPRGQGIITTGQEWGSSSPHCIHWHPHGDGERGRLSPGSLHWHCGQESKSWLPTLPSLTPPSLEGWAVVPSCYSLAGVDI